MKTYMYVATRRDLSVAQQVVQSCHAAIEASEFYHDLYTEHPSVIVLGVKDEIDLKEFKHYVENLGLQHEAFLEPDIGHQLTSVAVWPVEEEQRKHFKKFQLLK